MKTKFLKTALLLATSVILAACAQTPHHNGRHHHKHMMQSTHTVSSKYNFNDTVNRLESAIKQKGMTLFAVIDHQAAAHENGLAMQPAKVIIFGTPKIGTPLMVKDPEFALRLPLRVLVTETGGSVKVVFNDTRALIKGSRIGFAEVENTLANAETLIRKTVTE